jgi:hypothetical protein
MCDLHHAQGDEGREFLGLSLKPRSTGFSVWAQNRQLRFGDLTHKIIATIP